MSINNDESIENLRMAVMSSIWNLVFEDQDGVNLIGQPYDSGAGDNNVEVGIDNSPTVDDIETQLNGRDIAQPTPPSESHRNSSQSRARRNERRENIRQFVQELQRVQRDVQGEPQEEVSASSPSIAPSPPERYSVNSPSTLAEAGEPASWNDVSKPRGKKEVSKKNGSIIEVDSRSEDIDSTQLETLDWSFSEFNRDKYYPRDSYSFLALNGPCMEGKGFSWPMKRVRLFFFGMLPFLFQITFFVLLFFHFMASDEARSKASEDEDCDSKSSDNEHTGCNMGGDLRADIVIAQIASLLAYMLYPNSSQQDVVRAIQMFPWCPKDTKGTPIGCIRYSCLARGIQSHCAICVVFLLVMTCDTTLDIILNLTAANFISELDTKAFHLARSGVFGPSLENEAKRIEKTELPACSYSNSKHVCYGMLLVIYALIFLAYGIVVTVSGIDYYHLILHTINIVGGMGALMLLITIISSIYSTCRNRNHRRNSEKEEVAGVEVSTRTRSTVRRSSIDMSVVGEVNY